MLCCNLCLPYNLQEFFKLFPCSRLLITFIKSLDPDLDSKTEHQSDKIFKLMDKKNNQNFTLQTFVYILILNYLLYAIFASKNVTEDDIMTL